MSEKYIGQVYDGMWKVIDREIANPKSRTYYFLLENIYNHTQIKIHSTILRKVDRGETTISKIIHIRAIRDKQKIW